MKRKGSGRNTLSKIQRKLILVGRSCGQERCPVEVNIFVDLKKPLSEVIEFLISHNVFFLLLKPVEAPAQNQNRASLLNQFAKLTHSDAATPEGDCRCDYLLLERTIEDLLHFAANIQ